MSKVNLKVALLGNPNSGKSSLFNLLTGLNQKIGNFPGVTVDKKTGKSKISPNFCAEIIDLPGTYSLYPKSLDEKIVADFLHTGKGNGTPDLLIVTIDASNIKRNMLLFTQVRDLGFPVILVLTMMDLAEEAGITIDIDRLVKVLNVPIVEVNARTGKGIDQLKAAIACPIHNPPDSYLESLYMAPEIIPVLKEKFKLNNDYHALLLAHQYRNMTSMSKEDKKFIEELVASSGFNSREVQSKETITRYDIITGIIQSCVKENLKPKASAISRLDKILTHKIFGYLIFFAILFFIFQSIFSWASYPMDMIDSGIAEVNSFLKNSLPEGPLTNLLTEGLIAGLGGVLIFIPQIAILFAFISILEETGYMSRVMFLMDKIMRKFGMNGRSVVPLISGVACAVPAIMSSRSIDNWKERVITIFVTPLMSCSARIPVFTILIALAVPDEMVFGFLNLQGLILMALYLTGFLFAILSGYVMHLLLKSKERSFFIMEFPAYRVPRWKNVGFTIFEKVKAFVFEAGKVIIAISIVLWVLASYGPGDALEKAESETRAYHVAAGTDGADIDNLVAAKKLEYSYAGEFGKLIEPAIRPLGFDWKLGIAIITSFAAREVFIGTMATIYSVGDQTQESSTVKERMRQEKDPETGKPFYSVARSASLLIFYLFAMQCMSTLAVVYRETKGWKWPILQFFYMTGLAYFFSLFAYNLLR
ncbi:MAG: ferrous iron transport protein B [Cytophagaceae bacterium]